MNEKLFFFGALAVLGYVLMRTGAIPAFSIQRPAPAPAEQAPVASGGGSVVVDAAAVDWAGKYGASDSTGDPELDALVNGYGIGPGGAAGL